MGIIYNEKAKTLHYIPKIQRIRCKLMHMDFYCIYIMEERQMELWIIF